MEDNTPAPAAVVAIQRGTDGRHQVVDGAGNVLGQHLTLSSAQRQLKDYYEPPKPKKTRGRS